VFTFHVFRLHANIVTMPLNQINWTAPRLLVPPVAIVLGLVYLIAALIAGLPYPGFAALATIAAALYLVTQVLNIYRFIDRRIGAIFGHAHAWPIHTKSYPIYKFVDIYRGAQLYAAQHPRSIEIRSEHAGPLTMILNGYVRAIAERTIRAPTMVPRKISYGEEQYFPADSFWLVRPAGAGPRGIIRVRMAVRIRQVQIEVAAPETAGASAIVDAVTDLASQHSIYRNRMIRVVFQPEVRDSYGDDESYDPMDLMFYKELAIDDDDIILDDMVRGVIERTVVDFHERRDALIRLGLPGKRGVLFYGPPGTGKTYTCKYLAHRLKTATTIVATGHALLHMKAICAIAKMLQPALVLLEDVDLVFADREVNAYNTVLGEFIDQLDGFGETDHVTFILTTNAIERIEAAIKDRPGRVSQCIYFGPPNAALRRRYLQSLLRPYDASAVQLDRVVGQTDGVSQAFLKELVFRAVQIASADHHDGGSLAVTDSHVETALAEMTSGGGRAGKRIVGFHVE